MCPIQFEQIQFENALARAHTWPPIGIHIRHGCFPARLDPAGLHGALLMSFYCASGVLITAIFNLIYARQLLSRHDVGAEY